nr:PREDICTED: matrix metalloproteinase-18-like [Latimeria chalumnae]|eukprot:XP_005998667.2 PREDICTED: matrix metalloproteinase-18-like [Latimeria chalumnae]
MRLFFQEYLRKFYDFRVSIPRQRRDCNDEDFKEKLKKMQMFFRLNGTGELNKATWNIMIQPRCGLSDVEKHGIYLKWKHTNLTYRIKNQTPDLKAPLVARAIKRAWKVWRAATPLSFTRVSKGEADIMISFHAGDHADNSPFDGPGKILAHAFHPDVDLGGDVHFDEDETWTMNSSAYNLFNVAVHEFGHSLGLRHSDDPGAVMYPVYTYFKMKKLTLPHDDLKQIQEVYGPNPTNNLINPMPPKTPNKWDHTLSFDAVTKLQQEVFFFKDRFLWRKHPQATNIELSLIAFYWPSIPSNIDAAYDNVEKDAILIFKGSRYWAIHHHDILDGYPKSIYNFGFPETIKKIDAALHFGKMRETLFFVGNKYWKYIETQKQFEEGFPRLIKDDWPGINDKIDAAVSHRDTLNYFTTSISTIDLLGSSNI